MNSNNLIVVVAKFNCSLFGDILKCTKLILHYSEQQASPIHVVVQWLVFPEVSVVFDFVLLVVPLFASIADFSAAFDSFSTLSKSDN